MTKICNTEVKMPDGIELNEKDYCISLLSTLKAMEKNYVVAMTEASNDKLYNIYSNIFNKIASMQRSLYNLMFQNGWYQLETVDEKKLTQKYDMLSQEYRALSRWFWLNGYRML